MSGIFEYNVTSHRHLYGTPISLSFMFASPYIGGLCIVPVNIYKHLKAELSLQKGVLVGIGRGNKKSDEKCFALEYRERNLTNHYY